MARSPRWEPAYCEFFAARQRWFMRTAYAMVGSWAAAEDATQQTFTALHAKWPGIAPDRIEAYARRRTGPASPRCSSGPWWVTWP